MAKIYGADVVDGGEGTQGVSDRPAATCVLIGTAPIGDVHDTPAKRAEYINTTVTVNSREEAAAAFGSHTDGFDIPQALDAIFDQAGPKGVGEIDVINVYNPDVHNAQNPVANTDIIGTVTPSGQMTGIKQAYTHYQTRGRFSKIAIAPASSGMTGVRAELETLCARTRARALIDAPIGATLAQLVAARGTSGPFDFNTSNRRLVGAWPHMKVVDPVSGDVMLDPYSSRLAGVWLNSIVEWGYQHSPSNRPILGIEGPELPVTYIPGDHSSDPQTTRGIGVVSVESRYGKGPHTSGNRSLAWPTDSDMRNLLHVQFIEDMLDEMILHYLDERKDRNKTMAALESEERAVNDKLMQMAGGNNPIILDGDFRFDRKRTTRESIRSMQFDYQLKYAPPGIGETLIVHRSIDLNMMTDAYQLAS